MKKKLQPPEPIGILFGGAKQGTLTDLMNSTPPTIIHKPKPKPEPKNDEQK